VVAADAANFKEYVPLLLFTCPPPFRGWVASAASRKGAAVWAALRPGFRWFRGCGGGFALGHTFGVRVQRVQGRAFGPRVQKVQRAGIRILRMDGPSAQGFLSLTGPLAPRVADCPSGNAYKVSVTRFTLYVYRAACRSALQWCYIGRAAWRWEISRLRFASLEMTGRKRSRLSATRCPLTMRKKMDLTSREKQVIEAPLPPGLDNFQPSCYHLLKIRSLGLHTVELRFLSIRNISRSALFSVGRFFCRAACLFLFSGGLYESI
jgi:hypothetical protein